MNPIDQVAMRCYFRWLNIECIMFEYWVVGERTETLALSWLGLVIEAYMQITLSHMEF